MEQTLPSERAAAVRGGNDQHSTRDGVGMDGAWYCQRVCEGTSRCGSIRTCQFFFFFFKIITSQLSDSCLTSIVDGYC